MDGVVKMVDQTICFSDGNQFMEPHPCAFYNPGSNINSRDQFYFFPGPRNISNFSGEYFQFFQFIPGTL